MAESDQRGIPTSQIIRRARDRIKSPGSWYQGAFVPPGFTADTGYECPMCLAGALLIETTGDPIDVPISGDANDPWSVVWSAIFGSERARDDFSYAEGIISDLAVWNDDPDRAHQEVMTALERAERMALEAERQIR